MGKTKPIRRAVNWYSIRNRRAKAQRISQWMDERAVRTVLMVGAVPTAEGANIGIVEQASLLVARSRWASTS